MKISIRKALRDPELRREMEKESLSFMIEIYCNGNHHTKKGELCPECREFEKYALERTDKCPFMETKTFCSACEVHCYRGKWGDYVKKVMRYAGPRMMLHHPVLGTLHGVVTLKNKRNARKFEKKDK